MNSQPVNDKRVKNSRPRKASRPRGNWQLMILDEYGRKIQIKNLRRNLMFLGGVVTILFLTALCFVFLFFHERSTRLALQTSFLQIQEKAGSLIDENDALMARLAVLFDKEASSGELQVQEPREESERQAASQEANPEQKPAPAEKPVPEQKSAPEQKPVDTVATLPVAGPAVNFEDFIFSRRPDSNTVDVAFMLRKMDATRTSIAGHIFVVLKGEIDQEDRYLVIPEAKLTDGRPQPPGRGQYFSIARFKKITMSARTDNPEAFDQATVLAYDPDGRLLQEVVFPVSLIEPDGEETI